MADWSDFMWKVAIVAMVLFVLLIAVKGKRP